MFFIMIIIKKIENSFGRVIPNHQVAQRAKGGLITTSGGMQGRKPDPLSININT